MITLKRILVIRTGGVGDFILSLPVIDALADAWPAAEIEILGRPAIAALAQSKVTRIVSIDDRRFARLFTEAPLEATDAAAAYLSAFDTVVSFLGTPESEFGRKLRSLVPRTLFIPPPAPGAKHAVVHFLDCLEQAGIQASKCVSPRIDLDPKDREGGARLLERLLGPDDTKQPIILHPGSGGRQKNWVPASFARTVQLFRRLGWSAILLEGEADEAAVRAVSDHLQPDEPRVLKDASLLQVAGAIACSRLIVGNDSGISHLAAALGTPLVCLFGPTDPVVWRPLGTSVRVLSFTDATPERVYEEGVRLTN